ncbi:MAG TPA: ABC transporter permease, partial [Fimbriimonadaceae bacterium]|nr:ABC transporter permease [Fimbriimonadaceae bacterium]
KSLVFISLVTFVADELAPGDAATVRMGEKNFTQARYEQLRKEMGLDRPWPIRYVEYMGKAVHGDFGNSYYGTRDPVNKILKRALPVSTELAGLAILFASSIGLFLGTFAAIYENRAVDRGALSVSTLGVTVPNFVLAPVLGYFFAVRLGVLPLTWVPESQMVAQKFYYMVLPVVVLAARPMATLTRLTRASMIDTLNQEFIKLAVAKGVPRWRLYIKHALRNAILPVLTGIGTSFGYLLTGSFIVETAFTVPGIGSETIGAIQKGDTPLIMAAVIVTGSMFIVVNLLVDLVQQLIDPRIRESQI